MRLRLLADDECVELATTRGGDVQHGRGDWVGAERHAADGVEVEVGSEVEHHCADKGRRGCVEGDAAQVDVVVGLAAGTQDDLAVHDGLGGDFGEQRIAIGHGAKPIRRPCAACVSALRIATTRAGGISRPSEMSTL